MKHSLLLVEWENGMGVMCNSVGWEIGRDGHTLILAAVLEKCNATEQVCGVALEVPVANIHSEHHLQQEMAK